MPLWSMTERGNVVRCRSNCERDHEHYLGTYEQALHWFGVEETEDGPGKLINIVMYHQWGQRTVPKLSNELYDILMRAQSQRKWWAPKAMRHENAMRTLDEAERVGMLMDDKIIQALQKGGKPVHQGRIWAHEKWVRDL